MNIDDFKRYIQNAHEFSVNEMEDLEFMTDQELEDYQYEVEIDSGNLSGWDHIRAIVTFKKKINDLCEKNKQLDFLNYMENEVFKDK